MIGESITTFLWGQAQALSNAEASKGRNGIYISIRTGIAVAPLRSAIRFAIISCLLLLVFIGFGCARFKQASVEVGSLATTDVASQVYAPPPNMLPTSEKPVLPLGLPLEKLGVVCNVPHDRSRRVALTFDDGPSQMTPDYLNILREKGVHATFFLIGMNVQREPGMAAMIEDSGNEIGNHTFSHLDLRKSSLTYDVADILKGQNIIEQETHQKPSLLRPPGGDLSVPVIKKIQQLGYTIIYWNIDPQDWMEVATPEKIINNVMTHVRPGSIILLHEGKRPTLEALPQLIDDLKKQGYEIGTVSELLVPPNPWRPVSTQPGSTTGKITTQTPPGAA
jgi:peptidoglycan/xylan/chitin deacetylase (PgdA/CDA1 family)